MLEQDTFTSIMLILAVILYIVLFFIQLRNIIKFQQYRNLYIIGGTSFSAGVFILGVATPISFV